MWLSIQASPIAPTGFLRCPRVGTNGALRKKVTDVNVNHHQHCYYSLTTTTTTIRKSNLTSTHPRFLRVLRINENALWQCTSLSPHIQARQKHTNTAITLAMMHGAPTYLSFADLTCRHVGHPFKGPVPYLQEPLRTEVSSSHHPEAKSPSLPPNEFPSRDRRRAPFGSQARRGRRLSIA